MGREETWPLRAREEKKKIILILPNDSHQSSPCQGLGSWTQAQQAPWLSETPPHLPHPLTAYPEKPLLDQILESSLLESDPLSDS